MNQAVANYLQPRKTSKRYVHLGFHFSESPLIENIEPMISHYAEDWIRYSGNNWIVWSTLDPYAWQLILKENIRPNDQFLAIEIAQGQQIGGWLPSWIWEWLMKERS